MKSSMNGTTLTKVSLAPIVRTANAAVNGTAVDRSEFKNFARSLGVVILTGVITDGSHAVTLEVSDNNSDWVAAQTGFLQGSLPTLVAADDNVVKEFSYTGPERYIRVVITTSGATSGGIFGAVVLLQGVRRQPVARA
jgi:hypothetical protein